MIEVHGAAAATAARDNAPAPAPGGQAVRAASWIGLPGIIERQRAGKRSALRATGLHPGGKRR